MNFIDNLKLSTKSLVPLIVMALLFAGVVGLGGVKLNQTATEYGRMVDHSDPAVVRLIRVRLALNQVGYKLYKSTAYTCLGADAAACQEVFDQMTNDAKGGERAIAEAVQLDPAHAADYDGFLEKYKVIEEGAAQAKALSAQDKNQEAAAAMRVVDPELRTLSEAIRTYNDGRMAENKARSMALAAAARQAIWTMLMVGAAAILGGVVFAVWISTTKISAPLIRIADRMKALASGDLSVDIEGQQRRDEIGAMAQAVQVFKDNGLRLKQAETDAEQARRQGEDARATGEQARAKAAKEQAQVVEGLATGLDRLSAGDLTFGLTQAFAPDYEKLRTDFNEAMGKLHAAMSAISSNTASINGGSDEIAQASDDLSRRTEQQAASLEETAAALDQITVTVGKTADGARKASQVVGAAKAEAQHSGDVVTQAVAAMSQIEKSSQEISQIIGVIDEIAFQTNLLALNAGVEAARAGESGRGFAVVAQEVRALAQRSAEAAKEIKALISTSSQQVGQGVNLVGETGVALRSIVAKVNEIDGLVTEISASSQEQASGLAQINIAVNQMDQVTQQNAAMVEEATAAAAGLRTEAAELTRLVGHFRTSEGASDGRPQIARPGRHAPAANPVARAQARVSAYARSGGAPAARADSREEF